MKKNKIAQAIVRHSDEIRSYGVRRLYLFGSAARGQAGSSSDIDLFFDLRRGTRFSLFDLMDLRDFLARLLRRKVDLFSRDGLHPAIRARVVREAIRLI
jgi:hypothetical protein